MTPSPDTELLDLCEKVYELTKWDSNELHHHLDGQIFDRPVSESDVKVDIRSYFPLYTSDYLDEKLPENIPSIQYENMPSSLLIEHDIGQWFCWYRVKAQNLHHPKADFGVYGDTPLKARLKLVIALHEAGVKL